MFGKKKKEIIDAENYSIEDINENNKEENEMKKVKGKTIAKIVGGIGAAAALVIGVIAVVTDKPEIVDCTRTSEEDVCDGTDPASETETE